jgi:hypothetical protein
MAASSTHKSVNRKQRFSYCMCIKYNDGYPEPRMRTNVHCSIKGKTITSIKRAEREREHRQKRSMTRSTIKIGTKKNKQDVYTFRTCLSSLNTSSVFLTDRGRRRERERERKRAEEEQRAMVRKS